MSNKTSDKQHYRKQPFRMRTSLSSFMEEDVLQSLEQIRASAVNDNFERKLKMFDQTSDGRSEMGGLISQLVRKAGFQPRHINRANITRAAAVAKDYLQFEQGATCLECATEGAKWLSGYVADVYGSDGVFAVPPVTQTNVEIPIEAQISDDSEDAESEPELPEIPEPVVGAAV